MRAFEGAAKTLPVSAAADFQPTLEMVRAAWGPRTKGLLLGSPSNPTGTLISRNELLKIADFIANRNGVLLVDFTKPFAYAPDLNAAMRTVVESLTTEVGPRLAGTEAEARARDWAYVANNFGRDRSLFDLEHDEREETDIASRDRKRTDAIGGAIMRRAGKRLPVYH